MTRPPTPTPAQLHTSRTSEPWHPLDVHALVRAYDHSVRRHNAVRWAEIVPRFPGRSKEGCKAQVKQHKARMRGQGRQREREASQGLGVGFAPPLPAAAVLDLDRPVARAGEVEVASREYGSTGYGFEEDGVERSVLEVVTNRLTRTDQVAKPTRPRLSAGRVAEARRVLEDVARMLEEDQEWHSDR